MEEQSAEEKFLDGMARRVSVWGATASGIAGLIFAINAALESEWVGAGTLLIATTLAFAVVGHYRGRR